MCLFVGIFILLLRGLKVCYLLLPEQLAKKPCCPYLVIEKVCEECHPIVTGTYTSRHLTLFWQEYGQNVLYILDLKNIKPPSPPPQQHQQQKQTSTNIICKS